MNSRAVHGKLLWVLLTLTLTCAAPPAFPEPRNHAEALAALEAVAPERRDDNEFVRGFAEQALWRLWSRAI